MPSASTLSSRARPEQLDQGLAGRGDRVPGRDRRLRLHVQDQPVEVGALLDTGGLDLVGHPQHRRVDRVDRDAADLGTRLLVLHGGYVAATTLDHELDLQLSLAVQGGDVQVRVVHGDPGRRHDVARGHLARPLLAQVHGDRLILLGTDHQFLEVEDDVGDVLLDTGHRGELVQHAVDADAGHRGTGDGGEQRAPQGVAQRVAEAGLQRFDHEPGTRFVDRLLTEGRSL
jgi:hypothetical protein